MKEFELSFMELQSLACHCYEFYQLYGFLDDDRISNAPIVIKRRSDGLIDVSMPIPKKKQRCRK